MSNRDTDIHEILNEAKAIIELKREAEKAYKVLAEKLKAHMRANGVTELVSPEGAKAKLSTSNRTSADRKIAELLLKPRVFTKIFTVKPTDMLKVS